VERSSAIKLINFPETFHLLGNYEQKWEVSCISLRPEVQQNVDARMFAQFGRMIA
jgi:hypothetical protein